MTPMWLKNITVFTITNFPQFSVESLAEALDTHHFTPCGALDREQHGFTPAFGQESLVRKTDDIFWAEVKSENKVVPGSVVKRLLGERVTEIEEREVRKIGRKEKKAMKEAIIDELLATTQPTQSSVLVMIDPTKGYIVINSATTKKADLILGLLVNSIDNLEITRLDFEDSIASQMSDLLLDDEGFIFTTDSSLLLKGPGSPASTVRFAKHSLQEPEVRAHLKAGLRPAAMELTYNDRIGLVLCDPFCIKQLSFRDVVQDKLDDSAENPDEIIDGALLLQAGEMRELLADIRLWLGKKDEANEAEQERLAA